jgi:hypothetical protein
MRARRNFQPTLDSMPSRIAPSAVGITTHVVAQVAVVSSMHMGGLTCQPCDTIMPPSGSSSPINPPHK